MKKRIMKKRIMSTFLAMLTAGFSACSSASSAGTRQPDKSEELTVFAAASLTDVCGELQALYSEKSPDTELIFSFGSSGALQAQIEEGAPADIFFSASQKQMDALDEKGLMDGDSVKALLENRIVLIVPAQSDKDITSFEDAAADKVKMIGLGEPESVPAGQYAEEVFSYLGILDAVKAKANYGTDVRTVLSWVEAGEVDCGVVYATDAYSTDKVKIVTEAPEGSCRKVIYPVGIVGRSEHKQAAEGFAAFLGTDEAMAVFEKYGFSAASEG
ncbi:MAG: molybdate ABC transporter substrate-binding protein [Oscillospiraceae bacterium]|nr:molybdate ABC transporter substrate-binding protein [Oscillospiraceae bacterium]